MKRSRSTDAPVKGRGEAVEWEGSLLGACMEIVLAGRLLPEDPPCVLSTYNSPRDAALPGDTVAERTKKARIWE